jgi:hypothetical protein
MRRDPQSRDAQARLLLALLQRRPWSIAELFAAGYTQALLVQGVAHLVVAIGVTIQVGPGGIGLVEGDHP